MTALLPSSHFQGFGAATTAARWKGGKEHVLFSEHSRCRQEQGMRVCVSVFALHANLDVPVVAQTSWCCRRSSQKLFSSVVKFNFNVFLCHRMCSLPSCWGRPSRAALAGCGHPRGKQSCKSAVYPLTDFMKRAQASFPPSPSLSFPLPWTMHFPNRDAFP